MTTMEKRFYSFTNFNIRSWRWWLMFQLHGMMVMFQLRKTPGLIHYKVWSRGFDFYTLSCWETEGAMLDFRNKKAHRKAMRKSGMMGYSRSVNWFSAFEPYPEECHDRLRHKYRSLRTEVISKPAKTT